MLVSPFYDGQSARIPEGLGDPETNKVLWLCHLKRTRRVEPQALRANGRVRETNVEEMGLFLMCGNGVPTAKRANSCAIADMIPPSENRAFAGTSPYRQS